ncbi:MAG: methyltransferase domain-containing protein [Candidatus Helarchaeota archaeon]
MNIEYLLARFVRKFTPESVVNFFLQKGIFIKPGLETSNPDEALSQYLSVLDKQGISIAGKKCLLFGYGGNFGLGCMLLEQGATHVVLMDKYAHPNTQRNLALLPRYEKYLEYTGKEVLPHSNNITLHHDDIQKLSTTIDIVLSSSVFEHVEDVEGVAQALSTLMNPQGVQIHFIDLRDHFFKYPFEMLCYSEKTWYNWLNPSSYLNRYRMPDYQRVFETYFTNVEMTVLERNMDAFQQVQSRVRKEFLTGNNEIDSITSILIVARN